VKSEHPVIARCEKNQQSDCDYGNDRMVQNPIQTGFEDVAEHVIDKPAHGISPRRALSATFIPEEQFREKWFSRLLEQALTLAKSGRLRDLAWQAGA
jgi:hypothetical protein